MLDVGKILEFFKLRLSIFIALTIALAVFLFVSDKAATQIGIDVLRLKYGSYAGCVLLITTSLVVVQVVAKLGGYIRKTFQARKFRRENIKRLHNLLPVEKQILCGYILRQEKSQNLSIQDGNVTGLCVAGILYRASDVGSLFGKGFAFNIQEWAWEYLRENQKLITEGVPKDSEGGIVLYRNPDKLVDM